MPESPNHLRRAFGDETRPNKTPPEIAAVPEALSRCLAMIAAEAPGLAWPADHSVLLPKLLALAEREAEPAIFRTIVAGCDDLLARGQLEPGSAEWAALQTERANALRRLGTITENAAALQAAIAGFETALTVQTRAAMPAAWALSRARQASALSTLGRIGNDQEQVLASVGGLDEALEEMSPASAGKDWAVAQFNRANTLWHLGQRFSDASRLEAAVAGYDRALTVYTQEAWPKEWAETTRWRAAVFRDLAVLRGELPSGERMQQAIDALLKAPGVEMRRLIETEADVLLNPAAEDLLREAAGRATAAGDGEAAGFFAAHADLLTACRERGVATAFAEFDAAAASDISSDVVAAESELLQLLEDDRAQHDRVKLERQITLCRRLAAVLSRRAYGQLWGGVQHMLGNALKRLGELDGDAVLLREGVAAYRAALEERTRERAPLQWAATQNNLGSALQILGDLGRDAVPLREAVAAYHAALEERTRESAPLQWAATQNNLATALRRLSDLNSDVVLLREGVAAYRAALEECPRQCVPMDWALTQSNLGSALARLGELSGDAVPLREAIAAQRAALEEYTRERAPMDWALTQNNLGSALVRLGELGADAVALREGVAACRLALEVFTREHVPMQWAGTQHNLGTALARLGELGADAVALREGVAACRLALEVFTREHVPMQWAGTQHNLGTALARLGELGADAVLLRQAVAAFRASLKERTRERAPTDWARTHNNLGNALQSLGDLDRGAVLLGEAEVAYRAALEVLDANGAEDSRQASAGTLVRLLVRLEHYDEAAAIIDPTLARSDAAIMDASRSRDGRARAVEQVGELYSLGSLCHLRRGTLDIAAALVTAEAGRARLLADALAFDERRIKDLPSPARQEILATRDKRDRLRHQLGFAPAAAWAGGAMTGAADAVMRRAPAPEDRTALEAELRRVNDAYLTLCRRHGLIRAPEPLSYEEIIAAVPAGGALVLPVVTETEAFAFIVAASVAEVAVIDLPKLDRRKVVGHLNEGWLQTYYAAVHSRGFRRQAPAYRDWNGQIAATQAWLWEVLLGPIDDYLRDQDKAGLEKDAPVVLLPPGLLGLLPLQAAGPGPDGRYFGEHWTVSFAPSVKSLLACRERLAKRRRVPPKLLAVIDPPGQTPLAGARAEAAMLRRRFAHAEQVILEGDKAKLQPVLQHLPSATYVHPSTHGMHHPLLPQLSSLHLADIPLRLEMLHNTRLEVARLVFLSACESGLAGVRKMPEEFIGLPAGFVQAGAAAVAGSLWPVFDDAAFLLSDKFYDLHLDKDGNERLAPAPALRQAQDWLRHLTYGELKTMFPAKRDAAGAYLELYQAPRTPDGAQTIRPFSLPLGPDDECPYGAPHEWAAFTLTGA